MSVEQELAQENFMRAGGIMQVALAKMKKDGRIARDYIYQEYPKDIRISEGVKAVEKSVESVDKRQIKWTENVEIFRTVTVHSEEDEERVLSGGKTSAQLEADRQALILRCRQAGVKVDVNWTAVRLRRELGEKMDEAPPDNMAVLKSRLAELEEMDAMRQKIAALEAKLLVKSDDDPDDIRGQLTALGVKVDGRWSPARLREELDKATSPERSVA